MGFEPTTPTLARSLSDRLYPFPPNEAAGRNQHSDPYTLLKPCYRFFPKTYACYNSVL